MPVNDQRSALTELNVRPFPRTHPSAMDRANKGDTRTLRVHPGPA